MNRIILRREHPQSDQHLLPPPGRDRRTFTSLTARLPGSAVTTFAVIGPVAKRKSRALRTGHRPLCPATHEPALQTLVYRRRYRTDPDPLEHHRIPVPIIHVTSLPHSLHQ